MVQSDEIRMVTEANLKAYLADNNYNNRPATLGDQFLKQNLQRQCPTSKATVNFTSGAADGWDYTGAVRTPVQLKTAGLCESNYDLEDLVSAAGALGTSYVVDTMLRPATATYGTVSHDVEFLVEGTYIGLIFHHYAPETLKIWIDDEEIGDWSSGSVAQGNVPIDISGGTAAIILNINFSARGVYRVRVAGISYLAQVIMNANGWLRKPQKRKRLYVVSDSFYMSVGGVTLDQAIYLRTLTGLTVINAMIGGTGYLNSIAFNHPSRLLRMAAEDPDNIVAVIVNGSGNDVAYTSAALQAAQAAYYDDIRERLGEVPIVVIGIEDVAYFVGTYGSQAAVDAANASLKVAAEADPSVVGFISPIDEDWLSGTGHVGAVTGVGNQDFAIGTDGVHLSKFGMQLHAQLTVARMRSMRAKGSAA